MSKRVFLALDERRGPRAELTGSPHNRDSNLQSNSRRFRIESAHIILFLLKIAPAIHRRTAGNHCEFKRRALDVLSRYARGTRPLKRGRPP